jgi:hypothetical protein
MEQSRQNWDTEMEWLSKVDGDRKAGEKRMPRAFEK